MVRRGRELNGKWIWEFGLKIQFTGNVFVDAGLAGMCAAAGVKQLHELDEPAISRAVDKLIALITSDAAFAPRYVEGEKKPKTFAGSDMTVIQTKNGVLSQSSCKGDDVTALRKANPGLSEAAAKSLARTQSQKANYEARLQKKLANVLSALRNPASQAAQRCFVDGNPACAIMGNDEFPMVDSKTKRNFHPGLIGGHPVGALTALALEFFPLAVLRTGINSGFFWFVHTAQEEIAVPIAELTRDFMNDALAKKNDFGFFGDWKINNRGKETALVGLIKELTCGAQKPLAKETIDKIALPVTAYVFSNDSRSPTIEAYDLPHPLWKFFAQLRGSKSLGRWNREVLGAEKKGWLLARAMLRGERIVSMCLLRAKDSETVMLRGGWNAHAHYAHEVLDLTPTFLRDIESLSQTLFDDAKAKDWLFDLQRAAGVGEVRRVLLRFCSEKFLDEATFACLVPPDAPFAALSTRDYLLAALYDRSYCAEKNLEFEAWDSEDDATPEAKLPVLQLVEEIGASLLQDERHTRLAADLARATRTTDVRRVLLQGAKRGLVSWPQWAQFFPLEKPGYSLLLRDYLLAYVYTHMEREQVRALPEPAPVDGREARMENLSEAEKFSLLVTQ